MGIRNPLNPVLRGALSGVLSGALSGADFSRLFVECPVFLPASPFDTSLLNSGE